ncbi:MAG: hypothetical protein OXE73_00565 [Gammaproteobacteria bacterium]|nr:hypothetical protein [Gammaproteobacteria bacterium]
MSIQAVQQVVHLVAHEPCGLVPVKLHQPRRGLREGAVLLGPVAQAQPRAQPADQVPRFLDLPPQTPRLQDGVHQLELLPDGAGHLPSAEPREPPARGAERTGQEAPPLAAVGAQGLTLREHVLVPGLGDEDGIVPRAELGEGAGGLGHLLDARGLGDPTRAAVIGVPERRSVQGRARGADHSLHIRGLLLPERAVAAKPPDQLLRLPSQAAQRPRCGLQDVAHGMLVGGHEVEPAARPPHVFARNADRAHQRLELARHLAPANELLVAPRHRVPDREPRAVDFQPILPQLRQTADQVVRGQAAPSDRRVDRARVVVQTIPGLLEQHPVPGPALDLRPAHRQRALQLVQHDPLVGLVAVQLQTGVAQVDRVQAPLHDLQGGHLLRHEEDRAAAGQRLADQVGDGLRLPGARRPLDHQVAALDRVQNRERLRAVRVHHRMETRHPLGIVDVLVLADVGRPRRESVAAEELLHQRVIGRPASFRPGLGIEVLVDEQLAEGEEVQVNLVALDRPALPARDRLPDPAQVVLHVEIFLGRHLRQPDAEILLELGFEREVRLDVVPGPPELEALPHAGPVELHRDQDQRRAARGAAALGLVPAEHPEGEIEDVDPLFLDR